MPMVWKMGCMRYVQCKYMWYKEKQTIYFWLIGATYFMCQNLCL
jgi:hypothetical protein